MAKMAKPGEEGVRGGLTESAERRVADHPTQFVQFGQVLFPALPFGDARERAQRLVQAHPARRTFAAGFGPGELDEIARDVDHAVVVVHHHHAARTHDRADFAERFIINGRVKHVAGDATARRAAGLHRLDGVADIAAASGVINEFAEGGAKRHLHQAGVPHFSDQGENLGPGARIAARLGEPCRPLGDDGSDVEPSFDVVDGGRMAPQALFGRVGRARSRAA